MRRLPVGLGVLSATVVGFHLLLGRKKKGIFLSFFFFPASSCFGVFSPFLGPYFGGGISTHAPPVSLGSFLVGIRKRPPEMEAFSLWFSFFPTLGIFGYIGAPCRCSALFLTLSIKACNRRRVNGLRVAGFAEVIIYRGSSLRISVLVPLIYPFPHVL